jgi:hypothetical protein
MPKTTARLNPLTAGKIAAGLQSETPQSLAEARRRREKKMNDYGPWDD